MHQVYCIAVILAVTLNSPLLCWGFPGFTMGDMSFGGNQGGITISGSGPEHENGFYIVTNGNTQSNGKCIQKLEVHGNGFTDNIETTCPTKGFTMLNTDVGTFYGGSNTPLTLYSYEPSSLVVIENGKCTKKVYTTTGKKTTSVKKPVSEKECKEIQQKIAKEEDKDKKNWGESNTTNNFYGQSNSATNGNNKVTGNNKSGKKPEKSNSGSAVGIQNQLSTSSGKPGHGGQQGSISNFGNTYVNGNQNDFSLGSGGSAYGNQQGFYVNSNMNIQNGKCLQTIEVHGSRFSDTFKIPCTNKGMSMLNMDEVSIYGGSDSPFTLYSNEPSSLVVIENGKCTKKVYTTTGKKTTSVKKPVSDKECKEIKEKIAEEEEKNRKYWEEWTQNFNQQMNNAFPPCFPFCDESSSYTTNGNNKAAGNSKSGKKKKQKNKKSKSKPLFPPCFPFCDYYDY